MQALVEETAAEHGAAAGVKRLALILALVALALPGATVASPGAKPTPKQLKAKIRAQAKTITSLNRTIRDLRSDNAAQGDTITNLRDERDAQADTIARLRTQRDAQDAVIKDQNQTNATQAATIQQLRAKDPLDAVIARDPEGQWAAVLELWRAFPALPAGVGCGFGKSTDQLGGIGLVATTYTFLKWTGC